MEDVTEAAKKHKMCERYNENANKPYTCAEFLSEFEMSSDKARVLGIAERRINAAATIGEKIAELAPEYELKFADDSKSSAKWDFDALQEKNKGWIWAEKNGVTDSENCNSLSDKLQIEGCTAYVRIMIN